MLIFELQRSVICSLCAGSAVKNGEIVKSLQFTEMYIQCLVSVYIIMLVTVQCMPLSWYLSEPGCGRDAGIIRDIILSKKYIKLQTLHYIKESLATL